MLFIVACNLYLGVFSVVSNPDLLVFHENHKDRTSPVCVYLGMLCNHCNIQQWRIVTTFEVFIDLPAMIR